MENLHISKLFSRLHYLCSFSQLWPQQHKPFHCSKHSYIRNTLHWGFATLIKSDNPVEEEKLCNIFNGKWVYNGEASPLYNEAQCPFLSDQVSCQRNGRPDVEYEKWTWKAEGCEIPR